MKDTIHILLLINFMTVCCMQAQIVRYVNPSGTDLGKCDNPDYPCHTISYTILQAEADDTIRISEGIFTEPDGIIIENSVVLLGAGDTMTIIQAHEDPEMATSRVITVEGVINATIAGVTIRHGYANKVGSGSLGGGIFCDSSFLVLNKVRFYNNSAEFSGGALTCLSSSVKLSDVKIDSNFAYAQSQGGGGGIYMRYSQGSFSHVYCKDNSASWHGLGGGAYLLNCFLEIDSSSFVQNFSQYAGGIFAGPGSLFLSNTVVSDNRASSGSGGGIYTIADTMVLTDMLISGNYGGSHGGGICISRGYTELTDVSIRQNRASLNGGGIYNEMDNSSFENVVVDSNLCYGNGGGMFHDLQSPYTLTGITFRNNESRDFGGGLCSRGDSLVIHDIAFEYNQARNGGGLYLFGNALVEHSMFYKNIASESGGGMSFSSKVHLSNISFIENTATQSGGGLSSISGTFGDSLVPKINTILFKGNSAGGGGGMSNGPFSYPYMESVSFDSNSAEYGGGFLNSFGKPTFSNTVFRDNAAEYGGGLYNNQDTVTAVNTLFFGNVASSSGGAILNTGDSHISGRSNISLTNVTVCQNLSALGGGVYNEGNSSLDALNTIIWDNIGGQGKEIYNDSTSSASLQFSLCSDNAIDIVEGEKFEVIQCRHTNPLFVNANENDYQLTSESPAIDSGDPNTITGIFPGEVGDPIDLDQNPRIIGLTIDMGAFEWQEFVSLEKYDLDPIISIYPNPASTSIFVSGKEDLNGITIFNLMGQIAFEDLKIGSREMEIDISSLVDGLYIMDVCLEKSHYSFKIIKEGF